MQKLVPFLVLWIICLTFANHYRIIIITRRNKNMKKIVLFTIALLTLVGCNKNMPTMSPTEATLYVGDTLQLEVTGAENPRWIVGCDLEDRKDSAYFLRVMSNHQVVARKEGNITIGFQYYKPNTLGQQVFYIFTKLHILTLPQVIPNYATLSVGDTLQLLVEGIEEPNWTLEYATAKPEADIIQLIDSNRVVALEAGQVALGFYYDSKSSVGPAMRSSFTNLTIR